MYKRALPRRCAALLRPVLWQQPAGCKSTWPHDAATDTGNLVAALAPEIQHYFDLLGHGRVAGVGGAAREVRRCRQ